MSSQHKRWGWVAMYKAEVLTLPFLLHPRAGIHASVIGSPRHSFSPGQVGRGQGWSGVYFLEKSLRDSERPQY